MAGEYAVHILCDNEDIPQSPYIAQILQDTDYFPDKVEVYGPGVEPIGVQKDVPTKFTIDTRNAGSAPVDVKVLDANCNSLSIKLVQKPDGTIEGSYTPKTGNKHTIQVNFGGVATRKSPYRVFVAEPVDPSKVHCFGPGLEDPKANAPTYFNIDAR